MITSLIKKVRNKWKKIRMRPIRVYCLHHVCEQFDVDSMNIGDWMPLEEFKKKITQLQNEGVQFISLSQAYNKLIHNYFRFKKYSVIAFDDGYASLKEVLPWLEEQQIPAVLFINSKYLDGKSYRRNANEQYLTKEELFALNNDLIEVGSHGYEHMDASIMCKDEFILHIEKNIEILQAHPRYVPFHAYTWGRHTEVTDNILQSNRIIPVYIDGMKNYNDIYIIHRELI